MPSLVRPRPGARRRNVKWVSIKADDAWPVIIEWSALELELIKSIEGKQNSGPQQATAILALS